MGQHLLWSVGKASNLGFDIYIFIETDSQVTILDPDLPLGFGQSIEMVGLDLCISLLS